MTPSTLRLTPSFPEQPLSICEQTRQWIRSVINLSDEAMEKLDREKITDLITRTFPEPASQEVLQLTCDWTTLFCCLDDYLENFTDINELKAYLKELFDVYNGSKDASRTPFTLGMADIGRRIKELAPHLAAEFTARLTALFDAFATEANYRIIKNYPKLEPYFNNRKITVGVQTGFILGLGIQNINLPLDTLEHPLIKAIEEKACLIIGLENDLNTVQKELRKDEVNNGVIIHMKRGCTLDDAISRIYQLIRGYAAELQVFEAVLLNLEFSSDIKGKVKAYIDIINAYVESHRNWAANTNRYKTVSR